MTWGSMSPILVSRNGARWLRANVCSKAVGGCRPRPVRRARCRGRDADPGADPGKPDRGGLSDPPVPPLIRTTLSAMGSVSAIHFQDAEKLPRFHLAGTAVQPIFRIHGTQLQGLDQGVGGK